MAHNHSVTDTNLHFKIDAQTRSAVVPAKEKVSIVQHDHNSERITFEIPRYLEGHDMSLCNVVQVHYLNIDATRKDRSYAGVYEVDDLQISADSEDTVVCSWLISSNATQYAGSLNFVIRLSCVSERGVVEYAWNTAVHSFIVVVDGIFNADVVAEECADILAEWAARIMALEEGKSAHMLTQKQKDEIKALAELYAGITKPGGSGDNGSSTFYYDYYVTHNSYANNRCYDTSKGKFRLCCATFAEMVWLGRDISDFKGKNDTTYSNTITKAFDWGYSFRWKDRQQLAGAVIRSSDGSISKYYKYKQPLGTDEYSYSINTFYDDEKVGSADHPNAQAFNSFLYAADMAKELYEIGCEIPYSELDVGDLIFIGKKWGDDGVEDYLFINNTRFRGITHVAMVTKKANGMLSLIECTDALGVNKPIVRSAENHSGKWERVQAFNMLQNVVMCARHPAAFGKSNVPEHIDSVQMAYPTGNAIGGALYIEMDEDGGMVETAVTEGLYYVFNNEIGVALTTGTVSAWDNTNFDIQYTNA